MHLTITGFSSALFSTWIFVEELGVLFDAGDGVSACLAQKSRKIRHVFITHADRDHVCGLLQLHQLNAKNGCPSIYYPRDCGSFPAMQDFFARFDPQSGPAAWKGIQDADTIEIGKDISVNARTSAHIATDESLTKALDYRILRTKRSLRPEFQGLPGTEIARIRREGSEDTISELLVEPLIGYSGDAPALDPSHWAGTGILIHECTFLTSDMARREHANLPQVIAAAAELELKALILMHFSTRYSASEIAEAIVAESQKITPNFPIYAILPGVVLKDILSTAPVWAPVPS